MAVLTASMAAALLLHFPPELYSFYPCCPVYTWLHLLCPGCGATRALAALLQGQFLSAVHQNPLFVALMPFLLVYAALCCVRAWHSGDYRWPQPPHWAISTTLALTALFTVARNLPR